MLKNFTSPSTQNALILKEIMEKLYVLCVYG